MAVNELSKLVAEAVDQKLATMNQAAPAASTLTLTLTPEQQEIANLRAQLAALQAGANPTIAALQAEIEALKASRFSGGVLTLKVSEKQAVSLYGVNTKLPVTLYAEQWERVIAFAPQIKAFIEKNKKALSYKAR